MLQLLVNWEAEEMRSVARLVENLKEGIAMDHKLNGISFGELEAQRNIQRRFGNSTITDFDLADEVPEHRKVNHCEYYMKIIPHKFFEGRTEIAKETFKYSLYYQCKESADEGEDGFQLTFMHEISSVGITYRKEEITLLQTLTALVSIIGGVYVLMGLFHSALSSVISI